MKHIVIEPRPVRLDLLLTEEHRIAVRHELVLARSAEDLFAALKIIAESDTEADKSSLQSVARAAIDHVRRQMDAE